MQRTITKEDAALIKGMLARGDDQSDIAACFLLNGGRISEINTGQKFEWVAAAPEEILPPAGPYPSPFDLWRAAGGLWAARVALEAVQDKIDTALVAVKNAEQRIKGRQ